MLAIRNAKPALGQLLQRGSVGDDLWQRLLRAEKEIEVEIRDVVEEVCVTASIPCTCKSQVQSMLISLLPTQANALSPNWGQVIFQSANEMVNNMNLREKVAELQAKGAADRAWWDKERASIQSKFMEELNNESASNVPATAPSGTTTPKVATAGSDKVNSDEDAVLVEGGGPAASSKGGNKKKKGKK